jgi:hypothetical protein
MINYLIKLQEEGSEMINYLIKLQGEGSEFMINN